jgi:hypothetical protein
MAQLNLENVIGEPKNSAGVKKVSAWLNAIQEVTVQGRVAGANFELALAGLYSGGKLCRQFFS